MDTVLRKCPVCRIPFSSIFYDFDMKKHKGDVIDVRDVNTHWRNIRTSNKTQKLHENFGDDKIQQLLVQTSSSSLMSLSEIEDYLSKKVGFFSTIQRYRKKIYSEKLLVNKPLCKINYKLVGFCCL